MVNAIHGGLPLRDQAGQHQAGGGAQVGRHDRCTGQPGHAIAYGDIAFQLNLRPHALQFLHMHEPVLENILRNRTVTFGDAVKGGKLRLHVRRKAREGRGMYVHRPGPAVFHGQPDGIGVSFDFRADLLEFGYHSVQ